MKSSLQSSHGAGLPHLTCRSDAGQFTDPCTFRPDLVPFLAGVLRPSWSAQAVALDGRRVVQVSLGTGDRRLAVERREESRPMMQAAVREAKQRETAAIAAERDRVAPERLAPEAARTMAAQVFRRLFLGRWTALHEVGRLAFPGEQAGLADRDAFAAHLAPQRKAEWVVHAKRPLGGPEAVLASLSRTTHRVAILNSRLIAHGERGVTSRWKDYRARAGAKGRAWIKAMTLGVDEFIRRFLLHVLPDGFHRIRHSGLFATGQCKANVARVRSLLGPAQASTGAEPEPASEAGAAAPACPCCGGRLAIIERSRRGEAPRARPTGIRTDTSRRPAPSPA